MKLLTRTMFQWMAGVAVLFSPLAMAQEVKPVVVVSIASIEDTLTDVGYITKAAGYEDVGKTAMLFGNAFTGGFDKKKPIGAYVTMSGGEPRPVIFVPVTNLQQILETFKEQLGEPKDAGDGVFEIGKAASAFYKEQAGWVFIAQQKEYLVGLPADPAALLGKLPKDYNVAVKVLGNNVPVELKQAGVDAIKVQFERSFEAGAANAPPEQREAMEKVGKNSVAQITRIMEEMEEVTLGLSIDSVAKKTFLDVTLLAKDGTTLARQFAMNTGLKSGFSGFLLPEASVTANFVGKLGPEDITQQVALFNTMKAQVMKQIDNDANVDANKRGPVKMVVGQFMDVLTKTVESGKMDGGAALVLEPKNISFVAGMYVADGATFEAAFRKLVDIAKDEPEFPKVSFDVATHGGVKFHTLSVPIPASESEMREFFGPNMDIVLGTSPGSAYLAFGKNAQGLIKKVMDASATTADKAALPMQINVGLLPILKFMQSVDDNAIYPALTSTLEMAGNDKIILSSTATGRGSTGRFEIGEGVIKVLGEAVKALGGALPGAL
ncbi:hypothetical protein [Anatilimnocola floriformis]|uniref:hypothetical protein n=1 Tax=Anatilimnocola floriformis TaxID=2948575 RepID=UPI0020C4677C|nr:hypothetical protein [Anatilimnocola floriformis]